MGVILGIIGSSLPPVVKDRHYKPVRDDLIQELERFLLTATERLQQPISYANVTLDLQTGPWICNFLRLHRVPYRCILGDHQAEHIKGKLGYWRNQAIDVEVVATKTEDMVWSAQSLNVQVAAAFEDLTHAHRYGILPKTQKRQLDRILRRAACLSRNKQVIQDSDVVYLFCHCPVGGVDSCKTVRYHTKELIDQAVRSEEILAAGTWSTQKINLLLYESYKKVRRKRAKKKVAKKKFEVVSTGGHSPPVLASISEDDDDVPF